jgi:hypothetical protein
MSRLDKEMPASDLVFPDSDDKALPPFPAENPREFGELLCKLIESGWLCEVGEA